MSEIKCPNCGKTFKIDENSYAEIVKQVRDAEFSNDIEQKIHDATEVLHAKSAAEYLKLKNLHDKGHMNEYKNELGNFLKEKCNSGFESYRHVHERFDEIKKFLKNEFNDTINDKNKKVLCVTHSGFIHAATSSKPIINNEKPNNFYKIKNAEIISLII